MAVVCPTVTAYTADEYRHQIDVVSKFARRVHIDLTDGIFTDKASVSPEQAQWPKELIADFHLMFKSPESAVHQLIARKPNLVVVHFENGGDLGALASACRSAGVKFGVALMPHTRAESVVNHLRYIDHVLIFSGNLGYQGGSRADFNLLAKVHFLKQHSPALEIGWDGGVNNQNASQIILGDVDVLNVGGYIQSADNPAQAFHGLQRIADETGTT
jgi:ribulose-phosphate 3-epimerase